MSQGIRKTVLGALALALVSAVWAGGSKGPDTTTATGAGQNTNGAAAGVQAGSGSNGNGGGLGNGSGQNGSVGNQGLNGKGQVLQRKQARAARHADFDKVRQQALDSLRAAFATREAAEVAGSSESVTEKVQSEAKAKNPKK